MLTKTEWLIEWTNIVNCNGYLCDWTNDAKSVQWLSFLNPSHNQWATNLIQEDQSFNHSIICFWLLSLMKVRLIDWLTYCVIQRIVNEPINTWIDKRCSFYAVNNNYKIIITNKWYSATRILYIQSFFPLAIFFCFYLVNAWLRDWIDAYSVCYYLSMSNKQQGK